MLVYIYVDMYGYLLVRANAGQPFPGHGQKVGREKSNAEGKAGCRCECEKTESGPVSIYKCMHTYTSSYTYIHIQYSWRDISHI